LCSSGTLSFSRRQFGKRSFSIFMAGEEHLPTPLAGKVQRFVLGKVGANLAYVVGPVHIVTL
jgi:hypothetical protein